MKTLQVSKVLKDKILVSRESAHLLEDAISALVEPATVADSPSQPTRIAIDFSGVEGVAPSFLDELLSIFESLIGAETNGNQLCLVIANPPTRLSLKFEAIARGHGMSVRAQPDGSWLMVGTQDAGD
ncbi:MAG: STAS-like domain-containing protein [Proteobacteria bacterium]|nr:STAS-like domain-containing protein [Pseudomonadota bacterium]